MADFLARDEAPLTDEEWEKLDELVVEQAKKLLVGRRVLPLYGPLGPAPAGVPQGAVADEDGVLVQGSGGLLPLCENFADFELSWREIERARKLGITPDFAPAAAAAAKCADKEDEWVFAGCEHCGMVGLLTAEGSLTLEASDWSEAEAIYQDIARATSELIGAGHPGPFAVVMNPTTRALTHRFGRGGMMLHRMIDELAPAGVYTTRRVPEGALLVLCVGPQVADIAVGLDLAVAYIGNEGMNHRFRVIETVAVRIKDATGICIVRQG